MSGKLHILSASSTKWDTNNPVLDDGELALETDTKLFKLGDGITRYSSLEYLELYPAEIKQVIAVQDQQIFDNLPKKVFQGKTLFMYNDKFLYSGVTVLGDYSIDVGFKCNAGDVLSIK